MSTCRHPGCDYQHGLVAGYCSDHLLEPHRRWAFDIAYEAIHKHGALQKEGELMEFLGVVRDRQPTGILEIGSYRGGLTWAMRQVVPDAFIVTVDNRTMPPPTLTVASDIHVDGDSGSEDVVDEVWRLFEGQDLDLLFIDGDHSYEAVKRDYHAYAGTVEPGGLIAIHDVSVPHENTAAHDVIRFWNEIRYGRPHATIFHPAGDGFWTTVSDWGGIGCLIA